MDIEIDYDSQPTTARWCDALQHEIDTLAAMVSPREKAERAGVVLDGLRQAVADVAHLRGDAFRQLRASGWTLGRIARVYGLSRTRAQQLSAPASPRRREPLVCGCENRNI